MLRPTGRVTAPEFIVGAVTLARRTEANKKAQYVRELKHSNRSATRAQLKSRITWRGLAGSGSAPVRPVDDRPDRARQRRRIPLGTSSPVTPSPIVCGRPPALEATTGGRGERLEREIRQAVHVAGVVAHRWHGDHVGGGDRWAIRSCD